MLSTLPTELLQQIGDELSRPDQGRLRGVSKNICLAIDPIFFADAQMFLSTDRIESRVDTLRAWALGGEKCILYARGLILDVGPDPQPVLYGLSWVFDYILTLASGRLTLFDAAMESLLVAALSSLKSFRTMRWSMRKRDPAWQRAAIRRFLASTPLVDDLGLYINDVEGLSSLSITGLRKLSVTTGAWQGMPIAEPLSRLVAQNPRLTSLYLPTENLSSWAEIWNVLAQSPHQCLTEISAQYCPELLAYLASYSGPGLQKLHLWAPDKGDADEFFHTLLPRPAATLTELSCIAEYECAWGFSPYVADAIAQLERLESLEMSINRDDIDAPANAVDLLLRTTAFLPAMRYLRIWAAKHEGLRYADGGARALQKAVNGFRIRCNKPSKATVTVDVDEKRFEIRPEHGGEPRMGGSWAYREVPQPDTAFIRLSDSLTICIHVGSSVKEKPNGVQPKSIHFLRIEASAKHLEFIVSTPVDAASFAFVESSDVATPGSSKEDFGISVVWKATGDGT
ncbi:hypothetical protein DFH08DRAFT_1084509 [Mycena albidolilacea]|uniref:F-box domain-containing protein n=1 Tax=Mycena albidolilacea TaxID=1033008 RepID=A0AAD7EIJ3_9AGAR|nr:hypothetical protein DFH08DRAFT_1084509 [Mycena albidolilacea]